MRKLATGVALALAVAGCSSRQSGSADAATMTTSSTTVTTSAPGAGEEIPVTVTEQTVTITSKVLKVDQANRTVTLEGLDGEPVTIKVSDAVKNLPQVKVGDEVVAAYYESIAYEVKKPGEAVPGVEVVGGAAAAKPGEKPAGVGAAAVTVTATVTGIDKSKPSVTLTGPEGKSVTLKVRDPRRLEGVAKGDLVEITYSEAVAVSVEPKRK